MPYSIQSETFGSRDSVGAGEDEGSKGEEVGGPSRQRLRPERLRGGTRSREAGGLRRPGARHERSS
jgi:hypothetical protein